MSPGTILVVDEQREAQAVKEILGGSPYDVVTASRGDQALVILNSQPSVEIVLAEIALPDGSSGAELATQVRLCFPGTAVMLMTRQAAPSFELPASVLVKPFSPATLFSRIDALFAESRRHAESLQHTYARTRAARQEMEAARQSLAETVRRSRQQRAARICADLRGPDAVNRTVLVVDDDFVLRYAVCRFLTHCGFQVLAAADGIEALQISRRHPDHIDVLLTDLQMPGLSGTGLIETWKVERSSSKILIMTGEDVAATRPTLRKPFEMEDLLAEIAALLLTVG